MGRSTLVELVAGPVASAAACGSAERSFGAALGVLVAVVGRGEPFDVLGDEPADGGPAFGGGDLGAVDDVVVELYRQVAFGHGCSPYVTCSTVCHVEWREKQREKQTVSKAVNGGQPRSLRSVRNRCVWSTTVNRGQRRTTPGTDQKVGGSTPSERADHRRR